MGVRSTVTPSSVNQQLFVLRAADLAVTTDQAFTKVFGGTKYVVTNVVGLRKSGAFGTACLGGIYSAASKGGDALVAATQTWAALTGANTAVNATLATIALTAVETATPYFSLTTANTGALTADLFIFGVVVD